MTGGDLGGASPLWAIVLLMLIGWPVAYAVWYGIRHRESRPRRHDDTSEELARLQLYKDLKDVQNGGKGW